VEVRYTVCRNCAEIRRQLGGPLSPVTPVSLAVGTGALYGALRRYKTTHPAARHHARELAGLLAAFLHRHLRCVAPGGIDTVMVVPSQCGRPPPHPLAGVLQAVPGLPAAAGLLRPGDRGVDRRRASRDGVGVTASLAGRRVLLLDDTYTTGAHLQSAAWAIRSHGAAVHPVVIGRFLRSAWPPSHRLLAWAAEHPWAVARCVHCAPLGPCTARSHPPASMRAPGAGPGEDAGRGEGDRKAGGTGHG
jgi:hypothetical protein